MSRIRDLTWRVKSKGRDGESGLLCQLQLVGNYLTLVFFVFMQRDLCTLTKPPSAGLIWNTISCRNLTVQQANYFYGMWPFHYRRRKSELCFHFNTMTCWQTVPETPLGLVYWSDGVEPHHSVHWLFTCEQTWGEGRLSIKNVYSLINTGEKKTHQQQKGD